MVTITLAAAAGASVVAAAANGVAGGPNYIGIAAVIAAAASAFGTVVAGVITILRYVRRDAPISAEDVAAAVQKALEARDTI